LGGWQFKASPGKYSQDPISKITEAKCTGGVAQAVECLLCKHKALSSDPNLTHTHTHTHTCAQIELCLFSHRYPSFPVQDVCTALLITAFNSLAWKDTLSCQRTTTQLCWPLLKQVWLSTLLPELKEGLGHAN
jgi:hypothetical protein